MHDLLNTLPRRLSVLLILLSVVLFPAVAATTPVPLGVEILSGTCSLATVPSSGIVDPITADPEQDLANGGIYGQKPLTLKVSDCLGVGGGARKPVVTVSGETLTDPMNLSSVTSAVLFRDDGGSEVQYAGFVLNKSANDTTWNISNFYAAGQDIEFGPQGKSCNSSVASSQCGDVVLYVSLACGDTTDCKTNFTPESNTGKLLANVTFTFSYK